MSSGLDEEPKEEVERTELRRSKRTRKTVIPFGGVSEEDTEVESEFETAGPVVEWKIGTEVVRDEEESVTGGSEYSFGDFSNTAQFKYSYPVDKHKENMSNSKDHVDRSGRVTESTDSGRGATPDAGLGEFMKMYINEQRRRDDRREEERREENDRREEERREEREQRERERAEAREREERLWMTVNRAPATPEPVAAPRPSINLPKMLESEEITEFLPKFELALRLNKVPDEQKRAALNSRVPIESLIKCKTQVDVEECSYDDLVGALGSSSTLTYSAAAEDLCTGKRGKIWEMDGRKAGLKVKALLGQITREADDREAMIDCISVALLRDKLVAPLKTYIDSSRRFEYGDFMNSCEEW